MTQRPGHDIARPSRRGLLTGGLALGASLTLPGCAYIRDDAPTDAPLPPSAKAKIDGDLVYFNWADYLAPSVVKGFQEEYGVKVIESNYDSMEGMYAKLAAGNEYDIVFPIAKWVVKLKREGKLRSIDPAQLKNADQVFYSGSYFNEPWYDGGSEVIGPLHRLQDRDRLAHRQGVDDDRQLGGPLERRGPRPHLHPRRPGRSAGDGRPPARLRRQHRRVLGARRHQGPPDHPEGVPPGLLLRRRQQHGER